MADESSQADQQDHGDPSDKPGNPLLKNPFSDQADPKHSLLTPYFQIMDSFQTLAEEYPDVSALWNAEFGHWRVWPLPYRDAKVLSEHISGSEDVPYSPGADLHLDYNAVNAVERLIVDAGIKQDQLNKILTRDRWLATQRFNASDLWLHSIREFWLEAQESVEASGTDLANFARVAEEHGYSPGTSTAVGRRVWSLMVTQHKPLKQIVKEHQLSTGDEIDATEEPASWLESGKIPHVFAASVYFCGVLAARRAGELSDSQGSIACVPSKPAAVAQPALDLAGDVPHFVFRYGQDFPTEAQEAIETVRLEANRKYAAKSVTTFEEWMSAREEWLSELAYGAAPVFGRVSVKLHWSADHRRDVLKDFIIQAAAGHVTIPRVQRFFAPPRAKQLDDALFPAASPNTRERNRVSAEPEDAASGDNDVGQARAEASVEQIDEGSTELPDPIGDGQEHRSKTAETTPTLDLLERVDEAAERGSDAQRETSTDDGRPVRASPAETESVFPSGQAEIFGSTPPRRTPDLELSRERMLLCKKLARELATIKLDLKGFCEAAELKSKHAGFTLWEHITKSELSELISGTPFTPKAFAENLVLRHYGLTSRESLKKDRQKLRKHQDIPQ